MVLPSELCPFIIYKSVVEQEIYKQSAWKTRGCLLMLVYEFDFVSARLLLLTFTGVYNRRDAYQTTVPHTHVHSQTQIIPS